MASDVSVQGCPSVLDVPGIETDRGQGPQHIHHGIGVFSDRSERAAARHMALYRSWYLRSLFISLCTAGLCYGSDAQESLFHITPCVLPVVRVELHCFQRPLDDGTLGRLLGRSLVSNAPLLHLERLPFKQAGQCFGDEPGVCRAARYVDIHLYYLVYRINPI